METGITENIAAKETNEPSMVYVLPRPQLLDLIELTRNLSTGYGSTKILDMFLQGHVVRQFSPTSTDLGEIIVEDNNEPNGNVWNKVLSPPPYIDPFWDSVPETFEATIFKHRFDTGGVQAAVSTEFGNFAIVNEDQDWATDRYGIKVKVTPAKEYYKTVRIIKNEPILGINKSFCTCENKELPNGVKCKCIYSK